MPWKGKSIMELREEFIRKALRSEKPFRHLCQEYGISEKTGYKWKNRFIEKGTSGLADMSRRPKKSPKQLDEDAVIKIIQIRRAHPYWGPKKIQILLKKELKEIPSESSIKRILDKAKLTKKAKVKKVNPETIGNIFRKMIQAEEPNDVWCMDFKGYWYSDNEKIIPFTVRDLCTRKILEIRAVPTTSTEYVRQVLAEVFRKYGLPKVIRSDNGEPFASSSNQLGLTRLSAWLISLGIRPDRTKPGTPGQNGSLERMHADMARELEKKIAGGISACQAAFDKWREEYNSIRPNEAIGMKVPDDLYQPSPRKYEGDSDEIIYPSSFAVRHINKKGQLKFKGHEIFVSNALNGFSVGLEDISENDFRLWLAELPLGTVHTNTDSFEFINEDTGNTTT